MGARRGGRGGRGWVLPGAICVATARKCTCAASAGAAYEEHRVPASEARREHRVCCAAQRVRAVSQRLGCSAGISNQELAPTPMDGRAGAAVSLQRGNSGRPPGAQCAQLAPSTCRRPAGAESQPGRKIAPKEARGGCRLRQTAAKAEKTPGSPFSRRFCCHRGARNVLMRGGPRSLWGGTSPKSAGGAALAARPFPASIGERQSS